MEQYQEVQLNRLQEAEEKAYERRNKAEDFIDNVLGRKIEPALFFTLRQAFSEYEDAEERCAKATDRLNEYRSNIEL
jgi:hypothetical protein